MRSRKQIIGVAYAATGGAKVVGALVQLVVLPIAAVALGAEKFGLLFTMAALASFPLIPVAGFNPMASVLMTKALAPGNRHAVVRCFWTLWLMSLLFGTAMVTILGIALYLFDMPGSGDTLLVGAFLLFVLLNYLVAVTEGARAALRQAHFNGLFAIAGSLVTLFLILTPPTAAASAYYFAAIYIVPLLAQACNLLLLMIHNRFFDITPGIDAHLRPEIMRRLLSNNEAQGGMVLYLHGSVYVLAALFGTAAVAAIGAFVRIAVLLHSLLLALALPILPSLTEAATSNDYRWLSRGIVFLLSAALLVLGAQAIATTLAGEWIIQDVFMLEGTTDTIFFAAVAAFIFNYSATHILFLVTQSTNRDGSGGQRILAAAIVGLCLAVLWARSDAVLFLCIQSATMALWALFTYWRDLWPLIREIRSERSS